MEREGEEVWLWGVYILYITYKRRGGVRGVGEVG